jgi:hypothetical protein
MNIELGSRLFDGPHLLKEWNPLNFPAIYAIMMKPDPKNERDTYLVLYFCESSEFSEIESGLDHPKYKCWFKEAGFKSNIYIGAHLMPNSSFDERKLLKSVFINIYKPVCNFQEENAAEQ